MARPLAKCPAGENLARQGDGLSVRRWTLDRRMEATGLASARFMDDWVVLAPTRWALRRAIVIVNETLRELRVEQHPDKTSIGCIERGFTFLGYWIPAEGVTGVAPSAVQNFEERKARLYEQNAPPEVIRERVEL